VPEGSRAGSFAPCERGADRNGVARMSTPTRLPFSRGSHS
jgi:hypothetical protein